MVSITELRQLVVDRGGQIPQTELRPQRHLLTRYVVPLAIVLGFCLIIAWSARESLLSASPVTIMPVVITKAEVSQSGTPLFQAAGWIEPRPTPVVVSSLIEGVVKELLVVEGQEVTKGQALATLIDSNVRIAAREAEVTVALRKAELVAAKAALTAATANFEQPLQLQASLADAEALAAKTKTELANLPFAIRSAESRLQLAAKDLAGKKKASDSVAGRVMQRAESELASAQAALEELEGRKPNLEAELGALERKATSLRTQLELKTEETRRFWEAEGNYGAAQAKLDQAKLALETAQLNLERMTIISPIDGRVLSLNAQPGRRLMGINAASERDASTLLTLYDPAMLQVRVDVRLENVRQVQVGQPVQIETAAMQGTMTGEVLAATSQADIQKNTLQVKVAIHSPPPLIRPDMLAQVTFLAPDVKTEQLDESQQPLRLLVPRQLVEAAEGTSYLWVADRVDRVARRRSVTLGKAGTDALVEVAQGLDATDKLIVGGREGLEDGERIRVTGDDTTLGNQRDATASKVTDTKTS